MTSVTTTCRDLAELLPSAQTACRLLFQECYKAGIKNIFITETYRSQTRQKYLYAQGRTRPGKVVTWTLNSNHKSRLAWDIAVGIHSHCMMSLH
ncbi:Peptidoglycan L-alanyl-D-glutamate endopeptidase OS=Lysinibacillus sphaericus OX=1421 GN=LS41612_04705 PE=4 SV=1 [Lysinibacillus sphaericus]